MIKNITGIAPSISESITLVLMVSMASLFTTKDTNTSQTSPVHQLTEIQVQPNSSIQCKKNNIIPDGPTPQKSRITTTITSTNRGGENQFQENSLSDDHTKISSFPIWELMNPASESMLAISITSS